MNITRFFLRCLSYLSRWLWRFAVLLIILVAALVSLGREMAPMLSQHKIWVEANLTASIGEVVTMEYVSADWEGLIPQLTVKKLAIGDDITVQHALLRVDLLGSVKSRSLVFDALDIKQGDIRILIDESTTDTAFDPRPYLEFLFSSADIRVKDFKVYLYDKKNNQIGFNVGEMAVENRSNLHQGFANISLIDNKTSGVREPLRVMIEFDGSADNIFQAGGKAHVDFGDTKNIPALYAFIKNINSTTFPIYIEHVQELSGQLWMNWQNERVEWLSDFEVTELRISEKNTTAKKASSPYRVDYSGRLAGFASLDDMQIKEFALRTLPDTQVQINRNLYALPVLQLHYQRVETIIGQMLSDSDGHASLQLDIPELDLMSITGYARLLENKESRSALKTLNPAGFLKNISIKIPLNGEFLADSVLRANLDNVSVAAWEGVPALGSVDGYVEAKAYGGFVEVASQRGFSMHYPEIYSRPQQYQRASGRVYWSIDPYAGDIHVGSHYLHFEDPGEEAVGAFWLEVPPAKSSRASELYLSVGLKNATTDLRQKYIPNILPQSLLTWLKKSIRSGSLTDTGFVYRGSLRENDKQNRTIQFYTRVQNGVLKFDPGWPELTRLNSIITVDNETVNAEARYAQIYNLKLQNALVEVKPVKTGDRDFLTIKADVSGAGNEALELLRETPLRETFGKTFDRWSLSGHIKSTLDLGISLGSLHEHDFQEISIWLYKNDLFLGDIDLSLKEIIGKVHYSSVTGLKSDALTALLWNKDQTIKIEPLPDENGVPDILISMKGVVIPATLARWSHLPMLNFLQGEIPIDAAINVPLDNSADVSLPFASIALNAEMKKVTLDLPKPFRKPFSADHELKVTVDLWEGRQYYQIDYPGLLSAAIEQDNQGKLSGDVLINSKEQHAEILPEKLQIRGSIDNALLADWLAVVEKHNNFLAEADKWQLKQNFKEKEKEKEKEKNVNYPEFDFSFGQLAIGSLIMDSTRVQLSYEQVDTDKSFWNIEFQNEMASGHYRYFDDAIKIPELELDLLKINTSENKSTGDSGVANTDPDADPLGDIVLQDLPAIRVHAKQVLLNSADVGSWRFDVAPQKDGVILENMFVQMPGLVINGIEKDKGAILNWSQHGERMETRIDSRIVLSSQEGAKNLFGVERIVESAKTEITGNLSWSGSPAMMSFKDLQGSVSLLSEKGRFLNSNSSTDLMRVINVFNFNTWARRLKLDFSDLYKKGVSFDKVEGRVLLDRGKLVFDGPLVMNSPSSRFVLNGSLDSVQNSIDASMVVTLPVNDNVTWIAALAAGLPVAAGVWVVSKVFEEQIDTLSSVSYSISGTLDEPVVKFERLVPPSSKKQIEKLEVPPLKSGDP